MRKKVRLFSRLTGESILLVRRVEEGSRRPVLYLPGTKMTNRLRLPVQKTVSTHAHRTPSQRPVVDVGNRGRVKSDVDLFVSPETFFTSQFFVFLGDENPGCHFNDLRKRRNKEGRGPVPHSHHSRPPEVGSP